MRLFFFGHHTVQALLDPAVLRSDSPLWRSSDSAASPRYCNLTSISVRFFVTCHYVTLLFVSDKNRFFLFIFFPKPLGKQPSGHYSCSQHPHKNNAVPIQANKDRRRERLRERAGRFCQDKTSTVLYYKNSLQIFS